MTNIADDVISLKASVAELTAKVDGITQGTTVDLTPVKEAITAVAAKVDDVDAKLTPTPAV